MLKPFALAIALAATLSNAAYGAQLCAWMVEADDTDDMGTSRKLTLWMRSDGEIDFYIKMTGDGIVNGTGKSNSPMSATYTLHAGQTDSPWSYGATLDSPARIDETVEIHKMPTDIFSNTPTPLLAKFVFQRDVPASEKTPSKLFQKKQCAAVR